LQQMETTEKRRIQLEESRREWEESMNYILAIVVISLLVCLLVIIVYIYVLASSISIMVVVAICIVVLSIGVILSARRYYDSLIRWNMDFAEYDYAPPALNTTPPSSQASRIGLGSGNSGSNYICFDSDCCAQGTVWNPNIAQCVLPSN